MKRFLFLLCIPLFVFANRQIPLDREVLHGKLPNGLTYYIHHHENPHEKISLRLVVRAGSAHEDEHELGIAHFLEHMVFRGSDNFADYEIIEFLEKLGAPLEADTNAETSEISTIYKLEVPKAEQLGQAMRMLGDIAGHAHLRNQELNKERLVVLNELEGRESVGSHLMKDIFKQTFGDSRYVHRYPAGSKQIVREAKRGVLKGFYDKWYSPDRMAIIVVGNIDKKTAQKLVRQNFGNQPKKPVLPDPEKLDLKMQHNGAVYRNIIPVLSANELWIVWKGLEGIQRTCTEDDLRDVWLSFISARILNHRMTKMVFDPEVGATQAGVNLFQWRRGQWFVRARFVCKEGKTLSVHERFMKEFEYAKQFGYTDDELDEAKAFFIKQLGFERENAKIRGNNAFIDEYEHHFLFNEPFANSEERLEMTQQVIESITHDDLKKFFKQGNVIRYVFGPSQSHTIAGWKSEVSLDGFNPQHANKMLKVAKLPSNGAAVVEDVNDELSITRVRLANGMHAVLKENDQCKGAVLVHLEAEGGILSLPPEEHTAARGLTSYLQRGGLANLSGDELVLYRQKHRVQTVFDVKKNYRRMAASTQERDLAPMFNLLQAMMTAPRFSKLSFELASADLVEAHENAKKGMPFGYHLGKRLHYHYNHPAERENDYSTMTEARCRGIYKKFFSNPCDFDIVVVGDFKTDDVIAHLERTVGRVPSKT